MSVSLHLLTQGTSFNISMDIGTHCRQPVITFNEFFSFKMARVASREVIMTFLENSKAGSREDIGTILVVKDIIVNLPI
jgi:hypothetical protein